MILDSHLHFGQMGEFNLEPQKMLRAMDIYRVDFGIVSNIAACEFEPKSGTLFDELTQLEINRKTVELVRENITRLRGQFWIRPHTEPFTSEIADFIMANREYFVGLKVHPFYSRLPVTDERYSDYFRFAQKTGLPIAVHTAMDKTSEPSYVYEVAKKYPRIPFIMVHMGLGSDHQEAINLACRLENLYLDTSWVKAQAAKVAIGACGSHKVLFGSDSPIDGENTYEFYTDYFARDGKLLVESDWDSILAKNAIRLFNLQATLNKPKQNGVKGCGTQQTI